MRRKKNENRKCNWRFKLRCFKVIRTALPRVVLSCERKNSERTQQCVKVNSAVGVLEMRNLLHRFRCQLRLPLK